MPIVTHEEISALAHCAQQERPGVPCRGFAQQRVAGIREVISSSYADGWGTFGPSLTAQDVAFGRLTERESVHIRFADPDADRACPFCGAPREIADQVRPDYPPLSGMPQDELLRRQRIAEEAASATVSASERQAIALEALVAQGSQAGEVEQLRALAERQSEQIKALLTKLEPNGDGEPKRKTAAKSA